MTSLENAVARLRSARVQTVMTFITPLVLEIVTIWKYSPSISLFQSKHSSLIINIAKSSVMTVVVILSLHRK